MRKPTKRAAEAALFNPVEALDQMPNAVLVLNKKSGLISYANLAAEISLKLSRKLIIGGSLFDLFGETDGFEKMLLAVEQGDFEVQREDIEFGVGPSRPDQDGFMAHLVLAPLDDSENIFLEWFELDKQIKSEREARLITQVQANKELMRNLAHEIKNPLGGIRGAAQLLDYELPDKSLKEYTKVMIKEVDRLQTLVDLLLAPHKKATVLGSVNIHEALERVRSLVLAEFPKGLKIKRNYDTSLPEITGDNEQLIQVVLNIVHNAAQALSDRIAKGDAVIEIKTRVARSITIAKQRYKMGLDIHVIDNGPGIPADIIETIFLPLVSGSASGSGLGLTLAQTYVQKHGGFIAVQSEPGKTDFHIQLPYEFYETRGDK